MRLELTVGRAGKAQMATRLFGTVAPAATVISGTIYHTDDIRSYVPGRPLDEHSATVDPQ